MNNLYSCLDWGKYAFSYFVYAVCGSYINVSHPGWFRTADAQLQVFFCVSGNHSLTVQVQHCEGQTKQAMCLQVQCVDRLLGLQCRPPLLATALVIYCCSQAMVIHHLFLATARVIYRFSLATVLVIRH